MPDARELHPVVYTPSLETPEPGEAETIEALSQTLREISEKTSKDYGHAERSVHAKSHAILQGTFKVLDGLAPVLAQGLFARPGEHRVVMRISTAPGDVLPDTVSTPRGLALKVFDVEGERLPGRGGANTQDFILLDAPAFGAPDAKHFAPQLKLLAKTVDKGQGLKQVLSAVLRALEGALEKVGGESAMLQQLGGRRATNPLSDIYYSAAPFLYGQHMVKFSLAPVSPNMTDLKDKKIDVHGRPNALRDEISYVLRDTSAAWELRVQFCTDLKKMPIEDSSVPWDEDLSPWFTVARIETPPQPAWTEARSTAVDDGLAFDVWQGLLAHRPLGSINRVRKMVYPVSAQFRRSFNGCPMHEPRALDLNAEK